MNPSDTTASIIGAGAGSGISTGTTSQETLPQQPYEVKLKDAVEGRYYQLNPNRPINVIDFTTDTETNPGSKVVYKGNTFSNNDRNNNFIMLFDHPHKFTYKFSQVSWWNKKFHSQYYFDMTKKDRQYNRETLGPIYKRNNMRFDSDYEIQGGPKIDDLLLVDVELYTKNLQKIKNFLKETIGPNKSGLYAPPSAFRTGGLLYRAAARKYTNKNKNKNKSQVTTTTTTTNSTLGAGSNSSNKTGGKRRSTMRKNKRNQTRKNSS